MESGFTQSRILIAGLGLIGGSVAKALKKAGCVHIDALDTDDAAVKAALADGVVNSAFADTETVYDIVICALPPASVPDMYQQVKSRLRDGGVFAELSGLKTALANALYDVLSPGHALLCLHPMAGSEKAGYAHASETLFRGAPLIITPTEKMTDAADEWAKCLAEAFGSGEIAHLAPELHDAVIADLSHLPHIAALAVYAVGKGLERFAGGSFRAITRVADINAPLWAGLLTDNAEYVQQSLARLRQNLDAIDAALEERDADKLRALLESMAKGVAV